MGPLRSGPSLLAASTRLTARKAPLQEGLCGMQQLFRPRSVSIASSVPLMASSEDLCAVSPSAPSCRAAHAL